MLFISFISTFLIVVLSKMNNNDLYIPILRTIYLFFFYQFGYMYKTTFERLLTKCNAIIYILGLICINVVLILIDKNFSGHLIFRMMFINQRIITHVITGITGILLILKLSELLIPLLGENELINYISNHTYDIMQHHIFVIFCINLLLFKLSNIINLPNFHSNLFRENIYYRYVPVYTKVAMQISSFLYAAISIAIILLLRYFYDKIKYKIFINAEQSKNTRKI